VAETGGKLGFITPLTHNFCDTCRRVRVTCTAPCSCAGQDSSVDLREPLRASTEDDLLNAAIDRAMSSSPRRMISFFLFPRQAGGAPAPCR